MRPICKVVILVLASILFFVILCSYSPLEYDTLLLPVISEPIAWMSLLQRNLDLTKPLGSFAVMSFLSTDGWHAWTSNSHRIFLQSACKIGKRMQSLTPVIDMVLLVLDNGKLLSKRDQILLKSCGWHIQLIDPIEAPYPLWIGSGRYDTSKMFSKLQLWTFDQYDLILYLDLDTVIFKSPMGYMNQFYSTMVNQSRYLAMARDASGASTFNAGVMMVRPSMGEYVNMLYNLHKIQFDHFYAEQAFLNMHYLGRIVPLPNSLNTMVGPQVKDWDLRNHTDKYKDVVILHYITKPWDTKQCVKDQTYSLCLIWRIY